MKRSVLVLALVLLASPVLAQTECTADCAVTVGQPFTVKFDPQPTDANVYRVKIDGVQVGQDLPLTTTSVSGVTVSTTGDHFLTVTAFRASDNVEGSTAALRLIAGNPTPPPDTTAPSAPTGLTGTATQTTVALTWAASSDNVGVVGYRVTRNGGAPATVTQTSYSDISLTAGTAYTYAVTAVDAAGNVSAPASFQITTQPLPTTQPCTNNGTPYSITISVATWTKQLALGARGRVDFTLANSFPVVKVQVKLGTQVVGEIVGAELRDVSAVSFSVPRVAGTYNLFVTAEDNKGCSTSTTLVRPLVVQ